LGSQHVEYTYHAKCPTFLSRLLRTPDIREQRTDIGERRWLLTVGELNLICAIKSPDLRDRMRSRYICRVNLVFIVIARQRTDVRAVDVDSSSQYFEVKTANQSYGCVFVQFDGQLRRCIRDNVLRFISPIAELQVLFERQGLLIWVRLFRFQHWALRQWL
jgi:hypothetical protein